MLIFTSEIEILEIIYSLFRGSQNIFLTIFCTKFVIKCVTKMTNTKVMPKHIFEYGIFYRKIARKESNYFPRIF